MILLAEPDRLAAEARKAERLAKKQEAERLKAAAQPHKTAVERGREAMQQAREQHIATEVRFRDLEVKVAATDEAALKEAEQYALGHSPQANANGDVIAARGDYTTAKAAEDTQRENVIIHQEFVRKQERIVGNLKEAGTQIAALIAARQAVLDTQTSYESSTRKGQNEKEIRRLQEEKKRVLQEYEQARQELDRGEQLYRKQTLSNEEKEEKINEELKEKKKEMIESFKENGKLINPVETIVLASVFSSQDAPSATRLQKEFRAIKAHLDRGTKMNRAQLVQSRSDAEEKYKEMEELLNNPPVAVLTETDEEALDNEWKIRFGDFQIELSALRTEIRVEGTYIKEGGDYVLGTWTPGEQGVMQSRLVKRIKRFGRPEKAHYRREITDNIRKTTNKQRIANAQYGVKLLYEELIKYYDFQKGKKAELAALAAPPAFGPDGAEKTRLENELQTKWTELANLDKSISEKTKANDRYAVKMAAQPLESAYRTAVKRLAPKIKGLLAPLDRFRKDAELPAWNAIVQKLGSASTLPGELLDPDMTRELSMLQAGINLNIPHFESKARTARADTTAETALQAAEADTATTREQLIQQYLNFEAGTHLVQEEAERLADVQGAAGRHEAGLKESTNQSIAALHQTVERANEVMQRLQKAYRDLNSHAEAKSGGPFGTLLTADEHTLESRQVSERSLDLSAMEGALNTEAQNIHRQEAQIQRRGIRLLVDIDAKTHGDYTKVQEHEVICLANEVLYLRAQRAEYERTMLGVKELLAKQAGGTSQEDMVNEITTALAAIAKAPGPVPALADSIEGAGKAREILKSNLPKAYVSPGMAAIAAAEADRDAAKAAQAAAEVERDAAKTELADEKDLTAIYKQEIEGQQKKVQDLTIGRDEAMEDLAAAQQDIEDRKERILTLQDELSVEKGLTDAQRTEIAAKNAELDHLRAQVETFERDLENADKELTAEKEAHQAIQDELLNVSGELSKAQLELATMTDERDTAARTANSLQDQLTAMEAARNAAIEEAKKAVGERDRARKIRDGLQKFADAETARAIDAEEERDQGLNRITELESELGEALASTSQERFSELQRELAVAKGLNGNAAATERAATVAAVLEQQRLAAENASLQEQLKQSREQGQAAERRQEAKEKTAEQEAQRLHEQLTNEQTKNAALQLRLEAQAKQTQEVERLRAENERLTIEKGKQSGRIGEQTANLLKKDKEIAGLSNDLEKVRRVRDDALKTSDSRGTHLKTLRLQLDEKDATHAAAATAHGIELAGLNDRLVGLNQQLRESQGKEMSDADKSDLATLRTQRDRTAEAERLANEKKAALEAKERTEKVVRDTVANLALKKFDVGGEEGRLAYLGNSIVALFGATEVELKNIAEEGKPPVYKYEGGEKGSYTWNPNNSDLNTEPEKEAYLAVCLAGALDGKSGEAAGEIKIRGNAISQALLTRVTEIAKKK